jgi:hypothetical protein
VSLATIHTKAIMGNESVHDIKMDNDEDAIEETQPDQRQTIKNKKMEELD